MWWVWKAALWGANVGTKGQGMSQAPAGGVGGGEMRAAAVGAQEQHLGGWCVIPQQGCAREGAPPPPGLGKPCESRPGVFEAVHAKTGLCPLLTPWSLASWLAPESGSLGRMSVWWLQLAW